MLRDPGLISAPFDGRPEFCGEVPEWSIGAVSKTIRPFAGSRGFESLPLRQLVLASEKFWANWARTAALRAVSRPSRPWRRAHFLIFEAVGIGFLWAGIRWFPL